MATITKKKTKSEVEQILSQPWKLVLGNDDYNHLSNENLWT